MLVVEAEETEEADLVEVVEPDPEDQVDCEFMKNLMKKTSWIIAVISFLFLIHSSLASGITTYYVYWYYNGSPVTNVGMQNYVCLDNGCYTLGSLVENSSSGSTNLAITNYPIPSPTYGYATYWYASCYQLQEMIWTPTCQNTNCIYTDTAQFAKYKDCISPIINVSSSANVSIGAQVNISASIDSAINKTPKAPFTEPTSDPNFVRDFLSSQVNVTLTIKNSTGNIIFTDMKTLYIFHDSAITVNFAPWMPTAPGNYTAIIQTTVPDCKCLNTIPYNITLNFTIPGCNNDNDCNKLDKDYCDGSFLKHDEGVCVNHNCQVITNTTNCNDGLYCDGQETCVNAACIPGTAVDCSSNNICGIATCFNNPDLNLFTWDFRNPFTSSCVNGENNQGYCTIGNSTITHTCSVANCSAQCDSQNPCANNTCSQTYSDYCNENKLVDYNGNKILDNTTVSNSCSNTCSLDSCLCSNCQVSCPAPQPNTYCVFGVCGAQCDAQNSCQNYCVGDVKFYSPTCSDSCQCSYSQENCNSHDGWYNTTTKQWVAICQCQEKEQQLEEYRDYSCSIGNCTYNVTNTAWVDTGNTRNKYNGTPCNDGLWCTTGDVCSNGTCVGGPRNCHETPDILCTLDSCDEVNDKCVHTPDNSFCDDGLYCNGQEYCDVNSGCKNGTAIDCSANNICGIATCTNNPDSNPFTYDFRNPFTSMCINTGTNTGYCTTGNDTITHACSVANCSAQCDSQNPCQNKCIENIYYYSGICQGDCICSYSTQNCNSQDGWYNTTTKQWISTGQCTEKEQILQQYRDYSCTIEGCTFTVTGMQWIDTGNIENKPDGTICDDGLSCTINDTCQSGVCRGTSNDLTPPQVLYVFSGNDWVGLGTTFYVDSKIIDDSAICIAPKCLVKIIDNQNKVGYLQGNLTYDLSIQKCRGFVTVNDTFHESSAKLVVEVWDGAGHYNSSYTLIGIDNSMMTSISGVNTSLWYRGGDWLNNVTATVGGTFGNLKECLVDINNVKPEHSLLPSDNKCSGNIRIPSNLTDGNEKLTITAININNNPINGTLNIRIDNNPPFNEVISPTNDTIYGLQIPIIVNSSDENSGVKNGTYRIVQDPWRLFGLIPIPGTDYDSGWIQLTFNGTTWNDNFNTAPLQSGRTYYLSLIMCDNAGNCGSVES
jgi:hypothetical protein